MTLGAGDAHLQHLLLQEIDQFAVLGMRRLQEADGENYYIRGGIIVVPKNAVIPPGTVI